MTALLWLQAHQPLMQAIAWGWYAGGMTAIGWNAVTGRW